MTDKTIPTPEELRKLLRYEPETGKLFWRERPREFFNKPQYSTSWNKRFAGNETGIDGNGVDNNVRINRRKYPTNAVIWAIVNGKWPEKIIYNVDMDQYNTKYENLKETELCNLRKRKKLQKNNTSGIKGVSWVMRSKMWKAEIMSNGRTYSLGLFAKKEDAAKAYANASIRYHGEFSRLK